MSNFAVKFLFGYFWTLVFVGVVGLPLIGASHCIILGYEMLSNGLILVPVLLGFSGFMLFVLTALILYPLISTYKMSCAIAGGKK